MNTLIIAARTRRAGLFLLGSPWALVVAVALTGCQEVSNNPHPLGSEATNTMFVPFLERSPK